jgi:hypothetical protein
MTSIIENARKRKQTAEKPEAVVSSDDGQSKSKARRVSSDTLASTVASLQVDTPLVTENATTANTAKQDVSIESIGKMVQDLFDSDNAKVDAALTTLLQDFDEDKNKCKDLVTAVGCFVLVHLLKNCLDKAIGRIPACDQVTELNELAELKTLDKTLCVIVSMTFQHVESRDVIIAIGGVEAAVKVMETFPKCQHLQVRVLLSLTCQSTMSLARRKPSNRMEWRFFLLLSTIT